MRSVHGDHWMGGSDGIMQALVVKCGERVASFLNHLPSCSKEVKRRVVVACSRELKDVGVDPYVVIDNLV